MAKAAAAKKPLSKSQIVASVAETSGISKKEASAVLEALVAEIKKNLSSRGPGALHHSWIGEDREEEGPRSAREEGGSQPVQAG